MERPYRLVYDRGRCISCRACVDVSPAQWFVDEDRKASLRNATMTIDGGQTVEFDQKDLKTHELAAAACPAEIIWIEDTRTGERVKSSSQVLFIPGK